MPDEEMEPTNPTFYHALLERNRFQAARLREEEFLPEARLFTHAHVSVGSNMVQLLYFRRDPVTRKREFERIAIPYEHFLLIARGIVDAHDEEGSMAYHAAQDAEYGE